jgi:hypothetical protein
VTPIVRTNFKFSAEQKKLLLEKFDAGLHYPTNDEKQHFAEMFGASAESVFPSFPWTNVDISMVRAHTKRQRCPTGEETTSRIEISNTGIQSNSTATASPTAPISSTFQSHATVYAISLDIPI